MTTNPFRRSTLPVPFEGWNLRASDVFQTHSLAGHLDRNRAWLQAMPRSSNQIEAALFPSYSLSGMQPEEVRAHLNAALYDEGYVPNHTGSNPTWSWVDGE